MQTHIFTMMPETFTMMLSRTTGVLNNVAATPMKPISNKTEWAARRED